MAFSKPLSKELAGLIQEIDSDKSALYAKINKFIDKQMFSVDGGGRLLNLGCNKADCVCKYMFSGHILSNRKNLNASLYLPKA